MVNSKKDAEQKGSFIKPPSRNGHGPHGFNWSRKTNNNVSQSKSTIDMDNSAAEDPSTSVKSTVIRQWSWLLKLHRFWGSFPFSIQEDSAGIRFNWISPITSYTLIVACVRLGFSTYDFSRVGAYLNNGRNQLSVEDLIVRSTDYVFPFLLIWELICIWIVLRKTKQFFNCWSPFEHAYERCFSGTRYTSKVRRWSIILFVLNVLCNCGTMFLLCLISYRGHQEAKLHFSMVWVLGKVVSLLISNGEDIKKMMMYLSLAEAYRNIRTRMAVRLMEFDSDSTSMKPTLSLEYGTSLDHEHPPRLLTNEEFSTWRKLISQLKFMVKLTGDIHAPHESVSLIHSVVIYTEGLFLLVKALVTQNWSNAATLFGILSWTVLAKMIAKIILAQRITDQEGRIADLLVNMDSTSLEDVLAGNEAKKMIDMIRFSPAKISLGGFISLDKQLLPKISSYVVAYLVVLFQFHLSTKWRLDCPSLSGHGQTEEDELNSSVWELGKLATNGATTTDNITHLLPNINSN